jgi:Na/Pi-cotransporter
MSGMINIDTAIAVIGGLAFFVYGMNLMSDGLQQVAGEKLKSVLSLMTKNRFLAIFTGAIVTAVIQSSSATTVMTVGFVNAGLLSLVQAIGVIFGANIGTTFTGQIISLKLDNLAMPSIIIAVAGLLMAKKPSLRGTLKTLLGFGLLFYGMSLMSSELKALAGNEEFLKFFSSFDCTPKPGSAMPFMHVLGAVAVGTVCTMLVQSSSATIGITIALAESGVISVWTAVPIVFGDNIGTTVTAVLASIGTNANARRAALAHALFNLLGTTLIISSFLITVDASGCQAPVFLSVVDEFVSGRGLGGENPGRFVAMAHTLFNVTNVIALTAFIPAIAWLTEKVIPGPRFQRTVELEPRLLETPSLAIEASVRALTHLVRKSWRIVSVSMGNCVKKTDVTDDEISRAEQEVDSSRSKVRNYLSELSKRRVSESQSRVLPEIIHCINDAERIADLGTIIFSKSDVVRAANGLTKDACDKIAQFKPVLKELFSATMAALSGDSKAAAEVSVIGKKIDASVEDAMKFGSASIQVIGETAAVDYIGVVYAVRDVARHLVNIGERAGFMV